MAEKPRLAIGLVALLPFARALAEDQPANCLPADLRLRVSFAEPKGVMETLGELTGERGDARKRALLRQRFLDAGCASVEEQAARGTTEPNLICRIPGSGEATIAIGSSPAFDGWPAAALLPEIARAVSASPRAHGYVIALLARSEATDPSGAREFAKTVRAPRLFVHVGRMGSGHPMLGPATDNAQSCVFGAISEAVGGGPVGTLRSWGNERFAETCAGSDLYSAIVAGPAAPRRVNTCGDRRFEQFLDTDPFVQGGVPVVGVYDFPAKELSRSDAVAYFAEYRVLTAYAVALDQLFAPSRAGLP
jgi:hypothetical protein